MSGLAPVGARDPLGQGLEDEGAMIVCRNLVLKRVTTHDNVSCA